MRTKILSAFSKTGGNPDKKRLREDSGDEMTEILHEDEPAKKAARLVNKIDSLLFDIENLEDKLSKEYYKTGGGKRKNHVKKYKHKYCRYCGRCKYCGQKW